MKTLSSLLVDLQRLPDDAFRAAHARGVLVQVVGDPALWQTSPGLLVGSGTHGGAAAANRLDPLVFGLTLDRSKDRVTVGRSRTADVVIPLSRISKQHAWFGWSSLERAYFISDMGSKNGTFLGGERLPANYATRLEDGDDVYLGPYPFRFHTAEGLIALLGGEGDAQPTRELSPVIRTEVLTPGLGGTGPAILDTEDTRSRRQQPAPRAPVLNGSAEIATKTSDSGYEVLKRLGYGGMADVVLARRQGPGGFTKEMAIKRLLPEFASDSAFLDMFLQEARLAARINHPNVVQIYELGADTNGRYFIGMEYVLGWDLATIIKRVRRLDRELPIEVVCRIAADIAAGLHAAHTCLDEEGNVLRIVHRDISPHNVMVSMVGISKITDFGISKAADSVRRTRPGEIKGKLAYMAPEQVDDTQGEIDPRTDVFAAALCVYEMLTLEPVFKRGSEVATIEAVLNMTIPDVREHRADVPEKLALTLARALSRPQGERYESAYALQIELERVAQSLSEQVTATRCAEWLKEMSTTRVGEDGLPDPRHRTKSDHGQRRADG